ncbi:MAG: NUDIX hydrolase [Candidatus Saccharimonadales bacterium]
MKSKVVAKAVIFNKDGEVLLLKRSLKDKRRPGRWDFPGGGVEVGEDVLHGVLREIREEAGLRLIKSKVRLIYAASNFWKPTNQGVTRLLYIGSLPEGQLVHLSFEHDEFKWADIDTALRDFPHPFYSVGLRYAHEHGLTEDI